MIQPEHRRDQGTKSSPARGITIPDCLVVLGTRGVLRLVQPVLWLPRLGAKSHPSIRTGAAVVQPSILFRSDYRWDRQPLPSVPRHGSIDAVSKPRVPLADQFDERDSRRPGRGRPDSDAAICGCVAAGTRAVDFSRGDTDDQWDDPALCQGDNVADQASQTGRGPGGDRRGLHCLAQTSGRASADRSDRDRIWLSDWRRSTDGHGRRTRVGARSAASGGYATGIGAMAKIVDVVFIPLSWTCGLIGSSI